MAFLGTVTVATVHPAWIIVAVLFAVIAGTGVLDRLFERDPLTNCLMRKSFPLLAWWMPAGAAIVIDLDGLKEANDDANGGHKAGDRLLATCGLALRRTLRGRRDYVLRWGGDEFVAMARTSDPERVVARIRQEFVVCGVSASVGYALWHGRGMAAVSKAIDEADKAMYAEKTKKPKRSRRSSKPKFGAPERENACGPRGAVRSGHLVLSTGS